MSNVEFFSGATNCFHKDGPFFRVHVNFVRLLIIAYSPKIKVVHIFM